MPLTPSSIETQDRYKKILDERRYENIKHNIPIFEKYSYRKASIAEK